MSLRDAIKKGLVPKPVRHHHALMPVDGYSENARPMVVWDEARKIGTPVMAFNLDAPLQPRAIATCDHALTQE